MNPSEESMEKNSAKLEQQLGNFPLLFSHSEIHSHKKEVKLITSSGYISDPVIFNFSKYG